VFFAIRKWIEIKLILNQSVVKELNLVGITKSSIPIVNNMSSIKDLAENVSQIVPWNITRLQLINVFVQHNTGVSEVTQ
jgi:hypothetical protein